MVAKGRKGEKRQLAWYVALLFFRKIETQATMIVKRQTEKRGVAKGRKEAIRLVNTFSVLPRWRDFCTRLITRQVEKAVVAKRGIGDSLACKSLSTATMKRGLL